MFDKTKIYTGSQINNTPTWTGKAGAAVADVRCKAVKYDATGGIVVATAATDAVAGIALITNDVDIPVGGDIDFQIKEIGMAIAGGTIKAGDELTAGADGVLVPMTDAAAGFVIGIALEAAAKDDTVHVQITKSGYKPKTATA